MSVEQADALPATAVAGAAPGDHGLRYLAAQVALLVLLLGAWQAASGRWIDPFYISSPSAVAAKLYGWAVDGTLLNSFLYTFQAMAGGFILGSSLGFVVGFTLGRSHVLARLLDPFITAIYCMPKIALAPLLIMWFGIGLASKVAMAALIVFFLVFLNTFAGVRDVQAVHLQSVRIMGASSWQELRLVVIPSAAAWVLTGLKVSVPYALIGAVVGELISSNRGIGFLIGQASGLFDTAGVFAGLTVLALTGIALNSLLKRVEKRALRWKTPTP
ncbi:MAG: ABC transporter permease [Variovorax sp.]|nr:MAG: ABC transporter permease [Variovorax sp.]